MFRSFRPLSFACLTTMAAPAFAQVYGGQDASGAVVLSNFQTEVTQAVIVAAPPVPAPVAALMPPDAGAPVAAVMPAKFMPIIDAAAREHALPPSLLHAVIAVESGYNPRAVSKAGAKGLMQLMPETGSRFGARDLFDATQNVRAGAQYLKWLLGTFDGDMALALAGYNAGENAVMRYGNKIPPYRETQEYVPKVLAVYKQLSNR